MRLFIEIIGRVYVIALGLAVLDFRSKCRCPLVAADQRDPMPEAKARIR